MAAGATVVGSPPDRSPSLSDYPQCDAQIHDIVQRVWGEQPRPAEVSRRKFGQGEVVFGGDLRCGRDGRNKRASDYACPVDLVSGRQSRVVGSAITAYSSTASSRSMPASA